MNDETGVDGFDDFEGLSLEEEHIDKLLRQTFELGCSELHLAVGLPPCVRMHGKIHPLDEYEPLTAPILQRMIYDIISDEQIQRFENELELNFAYTVQDLDFTYEYIASFRVHAYRNKDNLAAALYVIANDNPRPKT